MLLPSKICMTEYHHWPFILPQQSMGGNEYGISGHLHIFAFFEALNNAFKVQFFQGFIFTPYHRHWQHAGPCSSDLLKVETLLNNAFNHNKCRCHGMGLLTYMYRKDVLRIPVTLFESKLRNERYIATCKKTQKAIRL